MISVSVYQPGDIYKLQNMKSFFHAQANIKENVEELCNHPNAHIRTVTDKTGVISILGGSLLWAGTMDIWSVSGDGINKHPISYVKVSRALLDRLQVVLNIRRFQAAGLCGNPQLDKWFETLGFKREAVMQKYGPDGKDYFLWARVN